MTDNWTDVPVDEVAPGDHVKVHGFEFEVARIDSPFLGRSEMVCFIEDTPTRWHAYPAARTQPVQVRRIS